MFWFFPMFLPYYDVWRVVSLQAVVLSFSQWDSSEKESSQGRSVYHHVKQVSKIKLETKNL